MINNRIEVVDDLNSHALPLPLLLTTFPSFLLTTSLLTSYYFPLSSLLLPYLLLTTSPFPPYYFPTYFLLLLSLLLHLLAFALRFLSF